MSRITSYFIYIFTSLLLVQGVTECKLPQLTPESTMEKINEIMQAHATYHQLNPELTKRILQNYLEQLDPSKVYFTAPDIEKWTAPSDDLLKQIMNDFSEKKFTTFTLILDKMQLAVARRHELDKKIDYEHLPKHVKVAEFKDMKWVDNEDELLTRLSRIKSLQIESAAKLKDETKDKFLLRLTKRQAKFEEELINTDPGQKQKLILSDVLKATASALDAHTSYFTPDEATQFVMAVQQRLFGIGAQLRDDLNGFSVTKLIEGGPAALSKELKVKDRIIAVNGEPVVGMDIIDAVELIRGPENTPVTLTVIRETGEDDMKSEQKLDIRLVRAEVVLKESRYESSIEPYGDGVILYLKLYSFYQDRDSSSASDLADAIKKVNNEYNIKGIILDLRYNGGGILAQAVGVVGLFITKGIVVSIKDETGEIQHMRAFEGKTLWEGPLIVLVSRISASASEIVAQTLQDYGRALVVGDDHTFGKGSYQTFTLNAAGSHDEVSPQGEYKVTRGRYYTVSGKTPQLTGVTSDIVVPGPLSQTEVGEIFGKYPLENDHIPPNFDDDLLDIPLEQRMRVKWLYKFNLQKKVHFYDQYLPKLKANSALRMEKSKNYQDFLEELKKNTDTEVEEEDPEKFGQGDLQLLETYNIMKDLLFLEHQKESK